MKKGKIAILVDHKWRDLPGYAYLKYLLENNYGHSVWLIEKGQAAKIIPSNLLPDMVLFIHLLSPALHDYVKYLKDLGIIIGILPTEGMPAIRPDLLAGKYADYSLADFHFLWSDTMKDFMLKYKVMPEDKLFVCGCTRFDFYREPASKCMIKKEDFANKYNINIKLKTILFITNYTRSIFLANEERRDFYLKDTKINEKGDDVGENPLKYAQKDLESRNIFVENFKLFCSEYRNVNILLKPHPAEDIEFYRNLVSGIKHPNVRLIYQEYIWDLLNFTDVYIGRTCTTGVEAWFLNKPTITFNLNPAEYYYSEAQGKGSNIVRTYRELIDMTNYYLQGNEIKPEILECREKFIQDWCYKLDGRSTQRCAEIINKFIDNINIKPKIKFLHPFLIHKILGKVKKSIYPSKPLKFESDPNTKTNFMGHYDKYITQKDVDYWDQKIKSCLGKA
ncbi:MAG: hypothetical protein HZA78_09365 [Candidatus Schekmanbacteria bacterium]|nr:hypothetical protein [Candidatus Schekmanbacteria bacterium]